MTAKEKGRLKEAVIRNSWEYHYFRMMKAHHKDKYDVSPLVEQRMRTRSMCAMDMALAFMTCDEYLEVEQEAIRKAEAMVAAFGRNER